MEEKVNGGSFVDKDGNILGKHKGYPFYTIGQRRGLEIAMGEPMFVVQIVPETNTVILGKEHELERNGMWVGGLNLQKYDSINQPLETQTKIRYKSPSEAATIREVDGYMEVKFHNHVSAIAPGQAAVFYEGDDVIGGGWIRSSFEVPKNEEAQATA